MLKIRPVEESKFTDWYFEIDRKLLSMVLWLMAIGIITLVTAGSADAARQSKPWFDFIIKAFVPYSIGFVCLFGFSALNKKQIIRISVFSAIVCVFALLLTMFGNPLQVVRNGSSRWIGYHNLTVMPSDILKPFFIVITAWFLSKMKSIYGSDIFLNKEAWNIKKLNWFPYLILFAICVCIMVKQPDFGSALLYVGVLGIMVLIAGLPLKFLPGLLGAVGGLGALAIAFLPQLAHIRDRLGHVFSIKPQSQAWYSVNAIKHGGLFGSGDEAFVKDVLPESTNDFVYASIAEDWGAIGACALLLLLFLVLSKLIQHAASAKDDFVVYAVAGAAALFGGQICFNLMTALHLVIDKGMTLPFISYGGVSFITFCILFGMVLALIREDTWNR